MKDKLHQKRKIFSERFYLFAVWFFGFLFCSVLLLLSPVFSEFYNIADLADDINTIGGIFTPYLGPIIAFWYMKDALMDIRDSSNKALFIVAISCSILFNVAVIIPMLVPYLTIGLQKISGTNIEPSLKVAQKISLSFSFIVGPVIGFYFGKPDQNTSEIDTNRNNPIELQTTLNDAAKSPTQN